MKHPLIAITIAALCTTSAFAKDKAFIDETVNVGTESTLHFDIGVGSLNIETYEGEDVILDVVVKEGDGDWFSSADLDNVKLKTRHSGSDYYFEVDEEDTVQEWRVRVPADSNLDIDVGVGEVDLEDVNRDLNIDVGVGEVDISLSDDNYREIELESGVGGADLSGFKNIEQERALVSESIEWRGKGEYRINVDIGVGEVDVRT